MQPSSSGWSCSAAVNIDYQPGEGYWPVHNGPDLGYGAAHAVLRNVSIGPLTIGYNAN